MDARISLYGRRNSPVLPEPLYAMQSRHPGFEAVIAEAQEVADELAELFGDKMVRVEVTSPRNYRAIINVRQLPHSYAIFTEPA